MPYLYLLQRKVHQGSQIYKIGKAIDIKKRLKAADYRDCKIICVLWVDECDNAERELIDSFKLEFKQCVSINSEYEGNEDFLIDNILKAKKILFSIAELFNNYEDLNNNKKDQKINTEENSNYQSEVQDKVNDQDEDELILGELPVTKNTAYELDIEEAISKQLLTPSKKTDIENKFWENLDLNYNESDFTRWNLNNMIDFVILINKFPFNFQQKDVLILRDLFIPVRFEINGEYFFKVTRVNGSTRHLVFEKLLTITRLKPSSLQGASNNWNSFLEEISTKINRSKHKLSYYDLFNERVSVSTQEHFISLTTLKLFTKQLLTFNDILQKLITLGLTNRELTDELFNDKKIVQTIASQILLNRVKLNDIQDYSIKLILIKIINSSILELDLNNLCYWVRYNRGLYNKTSYLNVVLDKNKLILNIDTEYREIYNIVKKVWSS